MSLFECIDIIEATLTALQKQGNAAGNSNVFFTPKHPVHIQEEIEYFEKLKARLIQETEYIKTKDSSHLATLLDDCLPEMWTYIHNKSPTHLAELKKMYEILGVIIFKQEKNNLSNPTNAECNRLKEKAKLHHITLNIKPLGTPKITKSTRILHKYQSPKYKIADIQQAKEPLGNLGGACYGITSLMANHAMSPYFNSQAPRITITREVFNAQVNQHHQALDQRTVKKRLLTRRHFCPNKEYQAQEILKYAQKNASKDIMLTLYGLRGAHACYLRVHTNDDAQQEIWYMDPNLGAFCLKTETDFIELHATMAKTLDFTSYQLHEMEYKPTDKKLPGFSFSDIWFALETGCVYTEHSSAIEEMAVGFYVLHMLLLDTLICLSPFLCVSAFFPPVAAIAASLVISAFLLQSTAHGYQGLLGPVQFFKECCDRLDNSIHSWINGAETDSAETDFLEQNPC
ncbi:MAG: hypothetical protein P1U61_03510 [Legionellaceae bacterium]|nr:hypothetical protein [Legionellaceae bacterium]